MKFSKAKHKVLHVGWVNSKCRYRLGGEWLESSPAEKNLEVLVDRKLNVTQQRGLAVQKDNCILLTAGCSASNTTPALSVEPSNETVNTDNKVMLETETFPKTV